MSNIHAEQLKILIADDHAVVRLGLSSLIADQPDMKVVGLARNGLEAVRVALETNPDIVILDLVMPKMDGADATARIRKELPRTKILILTSFGTYEGVARALQSGAAGAITKTTEDEDIVSILHKIARGESVISPDIRKQIGENDPIPNLTHKQLAILEALTRGLTNNDIAKLQSTSPEMVRDHLSVIFNKIGASNRAEAVAIALKKNLLRL